MGRERGYVRHDGRGPRARDGRRDRRDESPPVGLHGLRAQSLGLNRGREKALVFGGGQQEGGDRLHEIDLRAANDPDVGETAALRRLFRLSRRAC